MELRMSFVNFCIAWLACVGATPAHPGVQESARALRPRNLALEARATASESYEDYVAAKASDGDPQSRWSGIPGHNEGVWFQLEWPQPVRIGEVVVRQFDRFVMELDVQVWNEANADWRTVRHFGVAGARLPGVVVGRFDAIETTRLRIGNITNGPSFTEVEAYEEHFSLGFRTHVASDINGNLIGIVTDSEGATAIPDAQIELAGRLAHPQQSAGQETWNATVRSDGSGQFRAPLPLALRGPLEIKASIDGKTSRTSHDACQFQYGLTPRGLEGDVMSLPGPWRFAPDPPAGFERPAFDDTSWPKIDVPAHWEMQGFHPIDGVGGYRSQFSATADGGRRKLVFDGVYSGAEVWVNGARVALHEGGATPFECDITDVTHVGQNVLAVRVTEHTPTSDRLDQMSSYADFPLGGIMRKVWLLHVPAAHVAALAVHTEFDSDYRDATLAGRVSIVNECDSPLKSGLLRVSLTDPTGKPVELLAAPIELQLGAWERADVPISIAVTTPRKWDAEHPNLYTFAIELHDGAAVVQRLSQRIGFRRTQIRGCQLLINGRPVKIRGTCHHDSHPLMGRAVTPELTRQDLSLIKQANMNAVRTSHYPPIPELLDIADELGLYVEDEGSFCWVGVSDDLSFAPRISQLTAELIARDRNHPSVFMWSLCNESQFGRGFELSRDWAHTADPTRPLAAATSAWLDLATLHNPITTALIDRHEGLDKPLLFDESFAPFQGIWGDAQEMWLDPGIRDYYVEPLPAIYEKLMHSPATQGSLIWCWADDIFCVPGRGLEYGRQGTRCHFIEEAYALPGRGLVGDAPWGLVDGWRRPKPEYWIVKKLHSPVRINEKPIDALPPGAEIHVAVENQYDFTDLNELRLEWQIGGEGGLATIFGDHGLNSIPPRTAGEIRIAPRRTPQTGERLTLTLFDPAGTQIDEFRLPLGGVEPAPPPPQSGPIENMPLEIREENTLAGRALRIIGGHFEIALDRDSGRLRRCVGFGEPLLLELPLIHLLPTGAPSDALPDRATWRLQDMDVRAAGDDVRVRLSGAYDRFAGRYELLIARSGEITTRADFEYSGPDVWVRELGMRIAAPRTCDRLEWARRAEWSAYPDDHIGRPHGAASALADHPAEMPPRWPWSQDNSPMGCNDFRSTKRNVHWISLACPGGAGVLLVSDGRHHARATVESDRISLHISDWYGGTGAGLGEWEQNYGRGRLVKSGERIESTLCLRLIKSKETRDKKNEAE
jgi:beta-galactosidase